MLRAKLLLTFALLATASAQKLKPTFYPTQGKPSSSVVMPGDGGSNYIFLTVSNSGASGIQIFKETGGKLEHFGLILLGDQPAQGLVLIPHTHTLAAGVSNQGVAFVDVDDALHGKPHPIYLSQGDGSGSGYLAVTPDGQFLFVANEYGDRGNVGVIALHPDAAGHITHPESLGHIPTQLTTPGIAISPAGDTVYAVSEIGPPLANNHLPGATNPALAHEGCTQAAGRPARPNGLLYVIDVSRAITLKPDDADPDIAGRRTIVRRINAGCSPVRIAVSSHNDAVYLTSRGDNKILVFDPRMLITDPEHALQHAIATGGTAPVGLQLFAEDKKLLIANSNRFDGGDGNATILDLATGKIDQKISTGQFPRNITLSPDGKTLYLSNYDSSTLEVIPVTP